ncbi:MAG: hypothetical protein ACQEVT_14205 [Pseudomonadota bacterium]|uniref:hypothetical protein n=1 Tax=Roseovarius TaxID=74030 RepID=UPI002E1CF364
MLIDGLHISVDPHSHHGRRQCIAQQPIFLPGHAVIILAYNLHPAIVAIIFVKAVGFGPLAAGLTLIVYSIGFVAKMLAERI